MNVYILKADANRFESLILVNEDNYDWLQKFDGASLVSSWKLPAVQVYYDEEKNKKLPAGDFPALAFHIPIFSRRAVIALDETLYKHGELLPLSCREGEYYAYNVTRVLDILNEDKSNLIRFGSGRIMDIRNYSFDYAELGDYPIFKLPQTPLMDVFVTEEFKHKIEESKLTGFTFKFVGSVAVELKH